LYVIISASVVVNPFVTETHKKQSDFHFKWKRSENLKQYSTKEHDIYSRVIKYIIISTRIKFNARNRRTNYKLYCTNLGGYV